MKNKSSEILIKYTENVQGLIGASVFEEDGSVLYLRAGQNAAVTLGTDAPSDSEAALHLEIYESRRDVFTLIHCDFKILKLFSHTGQLPNLNLLPETAISCGKVNRDTLATFLLSDRNLFISKEFGIFVAGKDPRDAYIRYDNLMRCARTEYLANRSGLAAHFLSEKHITVHNLKVTPPLVKFQRQVQTAKEEELRSVLADSVRSLTESGLFSISQGTVSVRLSDDSFLITPRDFDRATIKPHQLVLVVGEQCESGKEPSRSALLHRAIYKEHPDVHSIIIALPESLMVSACTSLPSASVSRFPFGASVMQPMLFSREISLQTPVAVVENDCAIVLGTSLSDAAFKLQQAEREAKESL